MNPIESGLPYALAAPIELVWTKRQRQLLRVYQTKYEMMKQWNLSLKKRMNGYKLKCLSGFYYILCIKNLSIYIHIVVCKFFSLKAEVEQRQRWLLPYVMQFWECISTRNVIVIGLPVLQIRRVDNTIRLTNLSRSHLDPFHMLTTP